MRTNKKRWASRSWLALIAMLATTIIASSAAAATGPPTNTTRPTVTGSPVNGKILTGHPGGWAGTSPITFKFQWARCSSTGSSCVNIDEASQSQAYVVVTDDVGHRLRVTVTATNSAGTNSRESAATAIIRPAATNAPVATARPSISGSSLEGNTLTASNGSWSGATPTSFTYQWQRCDATGAGCRTITDATSQTYSTTSLDVGNTLRVVVTASNANGTSSSISRQSSTIRSSASVKVSLTANVRVVTYGRSVTLSGTVTGASSGDVVTILQRPGLNRVLTAVGSTTTDANGSFSKVVIPRMHTVYAARADGAQSDSLVVNVKPGLRLRHAVGGFAVTVTAAKSMVGRYVNAQAFVGGHWQTVKRVFLSKRSFGISPTVLSTAKFKLSVRHGLKTRAFLTLGQAGPNYVSATSNTIRS
jgi:hypothetical protein